jgi:hypothetical protein
MVLLCAGVAAELALLIRSAGASIGQVAPDALETKCASRTGRILGPRPAQILTPRSSAARARAMFAQRGRSAVARTGLAVQSVPETNSVTARTFGRRSASILTPRSSATRVGAIFAQPIRSAGARIGLAAPSALETKPVSRTARIRGRRYVRIRAGWVWAAFVRCARSVEASSGKAARNAQEGSHAFSRTSLLTPGR